MADTTTAREEHIYLGVFTGDGTADTCLKLARFEKPEGATMTKDPHVTLKYVAKGGVPTPEQLEQVGKTADVTVKRIIARKDGTLAAAVVDRMANSETGKEFFSSNEFAHITLFTGGNAKPFESNKLPSEEKEGLAEVHELGVESVTFKSKVAFFPFSVSQ